MKSFIKDCLLLIPGNIGIYLRKCVFSRIFNVSNIIIEHGAVISIHNISVKENFRMSQNTLISALDGDLNIGENVGLMRNSIINANRSSITIGDNVMIAPNVVLQGVNHDTKLSNIPMVELGDGDKKNIIINENVWVGANVVVLPGVEIASGCVIAAGSVVSKSLTRKNAIYGGLPAKFIKNRE